MVAGAVAAAVVAEVDAAGSRSVAWPRGFVAVAAVALGLCSAGYVAYVVY